MKASEERADPAEGRLVNSCSSRSSTRTAQSSHDEGLARGTAECRKRHSSRVAARSGLCTPAGARAVSLLARSRFERGRRPRGLAGNLCGVQATADLEAVITLPRTETYPR